MGEVGPSLPTRLNLQFKRSGSDGHRLGLGPRLPDAPFNYKDSNKEGAAQPVEKAHF
jgi:hypothetical protein